MSSATVRMVRPCSRQNGIRSGMRAISPSSRMISQITPEGLRPARRARSTEASVCPARTRTPPLRARSGKMWPGRARSEAVEPAAIAGGDAGGDAFAGLDGLRKGGTKARRVLLRHRRKVQMVGALFGKGEADKSATVFRHEVDRFRGNKFGGEGEVALIFAVFVINYDHHASGANLVQ